MSYRLYGKKDRIQLLWVMSVPNATPESIGVSDGSQRDDALKGDGRAVADAPRHTGRAHHDPDQQVAQTGSARVARPSRAGVGSR